jgi:hypothetical protein
MSFLSPPPGALETVSPHPPFGQYGFFCSPRPRPALRKETHTGTDTGKGCNSVSERWWGALNTRERLSRDGVHELEAINADFSFI